LPGENNGEQVGRPGCINGAVDEIAIVRMKRGLKVHMTGADFKMPDTAGGKKCRSCAVKVDSVIVFVEGAGRAGGVDGCGHAGVQSRKGAAFPGDVRGGMRQAGVIARGVDCAGEVAWQDEIDHEKARPTGGRDCEIRGLRIRSGEGAEQHCEFCVARGWEKTRGGIVRAVLYERGIVAQDTAKRIGADGYAWDVDRQGMSGLGCVAGWGGADAKGGSVRNVARRLVAAGLNRLVGGLLASAQEPSKSAILNRRTTLA